MMNGARVISKRKGAIMKKLTKYELYLLNAVNKGMSLVDIDTIKIYESGDRAYIELLDEDGTSYIPFADGFKGIDAATEIAIDISKLSERMSGSKPRM